MEQDIREFLESFSVDELEDRGILRLYGSEYQLRATSVEPLIRLMKERNVTQLTAVRRRWHLTSDGVFANPDSGEAKQGRVEDLQNRGNVFNMQNLHINPHFRRTPQQELSEDQQEQRSEIPRDDSNVVKFGLERDLQRALRNNISQLEPGLKVVDGGTERTVEAGRIDVTAEDTQGDLVVIELKAGTAQPESIAQLLSYMGSIDDDQGRPVRGILVAHDFHPRLVMAARAVPNISLKAYSFQFSFEDR